MNLFDTRTQAVREFRPREGRASIYVCGITPYDTTHLGHAFTYTSADILIRYLEFLGYPVVFVQNVTDIDDDILRKAREQGEDWIDLGNRWTRHFISDMRALNVRPPDYYPRASSVIPEIIASVESLVKAGYGYVSNGNVYYPVSHWQGFGNISHIPQEEMLAVANQRGNHPEDKNKNDPLDFVLWQAQVPGEPAWPSPWGPGRPGWHIECSTISSKFLDGHVDVHGGGGDLIFPHHECEAAQVEPLSGVGTFVSTWFHIAMVYYQGEKMSKSLGNLVMVRDLLEDFPADTLRLYLASKHYRSSWAYDHEDLLEADQLTRKIQESLALDGSGASQPGLQKAHQPGMPEFRACLDDDLDTPGAVRCMGALADWIDSAQREGIGIAAAQGELKGMAAILGMTAGSAVMDPRVEAGWGKHEKNFA